MIGILGVGFISQDICTWDPSPDSSSISQSGAGQAKELRLRLWPLYNKVKDNPQGNQMTVIQVKVKPNAKVSVLERLADGTWLAQVKSPPVDSKANQELIVLVAQQFGCRKGQVSIKVGGSGRIK